MTMRSAKFRGPNNTDWGLPAFQPTDALHGIWWAVQDTFRYFISHELEARRLRHDIQRLDCEPKLSIGSGRTVPTGWMGIDFKRGPNVYACDLHKPLPFPDNAVSGILAEHIFEHFWMDDIPVLASECYRVLSPGCPIRIVCPDATIVAELLTETSTPRSTAQMQLDSRIHGWQPSQSLGMHVANRLAYQFGQHKALLTPAALSSVLTLAGFSDVRVAGPETSHYFHEVPTTHFDRFPDSKMECFVLEARKPENEGS